MPKSFLTKIDWLGHASFRLRGNKTVYIDPWKIKKEPGDADLILVTHTHYDHHSPEDITKLSKNGTVIVAPESSRGEVQGNNVFYLSPDESVEVNGVHIEAVRSYNLNKKFHPKENNWLGYIVELNGFRIYHSGDTDLIEEMSGIRCDIALLPVSGTYVMTASEALSAVDLIKPSFAIPMHWGDIVGDLSDANSFAKDAMCNVVVKEPVK